MLVLKRNQKLLSDEARDAAMMFYVVQGKVLVDMHLVGYAAKRVCFAVSTGGTWEVLRGTTYKLRNGPARDAKLLCWQWRDTVS
jgi:hypothetical protein